MNEQPVEIPQRGEDWHYMVNEDFALVLAKIKAEAQAKFERRKIKMKETHVNTYDSTARRQAKRDVQCVMAKYSEVPTHFGYRNVYGDQVGSVAL